GQPTVTNPAQNLREQAPEGGSPMKGMIIGQLFFWLLPLLHPAVSLAQESPRPPLNLNTAVEQALSAYPAVRVVQAQSQAASAGAADAFLTLLANEQTVRAAQANVERMDIFAKAVHTLVDNALRPGVDASRADAELAAARNQLIQAEQSAELSRAELARTIG